MGNFELSLNEEIALMLESNLTPTELFILRLLFLGQYDQKYLINYISNLSDGKSLLRQVLESLINKKVINSTYTIPKEGQALNVNNIPFNKNFLKKYIRESNELGKELFELYPSFISIRGKMVSIKNITKANLYSIEDFCTYYAKAIKSSGITHERVMDALRFGIENDLIHYGITEFVASMKWVELEQLQQMDDINGYKNSELI